MKNNVRIIIVILFIVVAVSAGVMYYQRENINPIKEEDLPSNHPAYRLAVMNLNDVLDNDTSSELNQIFSDVYVDPDTNTVHVTITRIDEASQQLVLDAIGSLEGINVVFHEGKVNKQQLDEHMLTIHSILPDLMEKGVNYSFVGVNRDALIEVKLVEPTPENVEIFIELVGDRIPREIIVITKGEPVDPA